MRHSAASPPSDQVSSASAAELGTVATTFHVPQVVHPYSIHTHLHTYLAISLSLSVYLPACLSSYLHLHAFSCIHAFTHSRLDAPFWLAGSLASFAPAAFFGSSCGFTELEKSALAHLGRRRRLAAIRYDTRERQTNRLAQTCSDLLRLRAVTTSHLRSPVSPPRI